MMNERQRMHYLDALGIDAFVPRFVLPVAKTSVPCALPAVAEPERESVFIDEPSPAVVSPVAGGQERRLLDDIVQATQIPAPSKEDDAQETPSLNAALDVPLAAAAPVRFSLALWHLGRVQVIDSRRQGDALPTDTLLSNILQAVGCLDLNLPKAEMLHWPMVERQQHGGWPAAQEMVQGFLDGRLLARPVPYLFLFGDDAARAVLGETCDIAQTRYACVPVPAFDAEAVVLPSLAEILYQPECKRDVWRALSELPRLRTGA